MAKDFYNQILTDTTLQDAFAAYNVTVEELPAPARSPVLRACTTVGGANSERQQLRRDRDTKREILETELRRFQRFAPRDLRGDARAAGAARVYGAFGRVVDDSSDIRFQVAARFSALSPFSSSAL